MLTPSQLKLGKLVAIKVMGECIHTFIDRNNPDGGGVVPGHRCDQACSQCGEKPNGYNHNNKWIYTPEDAELVRQLLDTFEAVNIYKVGDAYHACLQNDKGALFGEAIEKDFRIACCVAAVRLAGVVFEYEETE